MKRKILDSWKRPIEVEVPAPDPRYQQQLELQLNKTNDATVEEEQDWWENELKPKGYAQLKFVAMMAIIQFLTLGFMLTAFYIIDLGLKNS